MTPSGPATEPGRMVFVVDPVRDALAEFSEQELAAKARHLAATLLWMPDDRARVDQVVVGLYLVDEIPAPMLLGACLEAIVVEVLGAMARASDATGGGARQYLADIADRLQSGQQDE